MKSLNLFVKGMFWIVVVIFAAPLLWWMGRSGDSFEGETFAEYDDDDLGEDVDDLENNCTVGAGVPSRHRGEDV